MEEALAGAQLVRLLIGVPIVIFLVWLYGQTTKKSKRDKNGIDQEYIDELVAKSLEKESKKG